MPGMSGRKLCDQLRTSLPKLKGLYISGYMEDVIIRPGVATENVDFPQKPFTPDNFAERIRHILDTP